MRVLVVNAGSTSVKLRVLGADDEVVGASDPGPPGPDLAAPVTDLLQQVGAVDAVGHRVVHGGTEFGAAVLLDATARDRLEGLSDLAPLHNPPALAAADAVAGALPGVPAVACFDTSFHLAGLLPAAYRYALPAAWSKRWPQLRRYGFHGLSCEWATGRAAEMLGRPAAELRLVVAHLGGGASVTAVRHGRSAATSMGFTPLEGLPMATRSGDVDPGLVVWLLRHGVDVGDLSDGLERHAGLLGLSGGETGDMHELLERRSAGDTAAAGAVEVYVARLRAAIAAAAAAAGGCDALVFTGGVGEHAAPVRAEACDGLGWMGVALDPDRNGSVAEGDITANGAAVRVLVVTAREDIVVARGVRRVLGGAGPG